MMTALINIPFGSLLVIANDSLYDPTRSRQKEEDCTSSLTRFTYLDLIGFVVVVHIELCLLDFIRFFKLYKIQFVKHCNEIFGTKVVYCLYIWYRSLLNEFFFKKLY
jgi:hypothetical protein